MFEVDLEEFRTRCDDAGITPVIVPGQTHHELGIEGSAYDLLNFMLTVAPHLDDHLETVNGELDFRPEWLAVEEAEPTTTAGRGDHRWVWRQIRPIRDLHFALQH